MKNLNLLFIAPKFFSYENRIIEELTPFYNDIIFKTEIPFQSSFLFYAMKRFSKKGAEFSLTNYNKKLIKLIEEKKIDRVFIIRGFGLNEEFLKSIKEINPKILVFHYQWDSFDIVPNALLISNYSDYNFSFDLNDVNNNVKFQHLPLFSLLKNTNQNEIIRNDIVFIGTYHSNRINISKRIKVYCEQNNLKYFDYLYMPFLSYIRNNLQNKNINFSEIKLKKLSYNQYTKLLLSAKIIVDSPYEKQFGATMRTIETLSLRKKLISTNKLLVKEKFYSPSNILILNNNDDFNIDSLLQSDFDNSKNQEILSLRDWLKRMQII
jgi:hypothetical protein